MTALSMVYPVQNLSMRSVSASVWHECGHCPASGRGNEEKANIAATQGLALGVVHTIILTAGSILIMPEFLGFFTDSEKIINLGMRYSVIVFVFTFFIVTGVAFEKIFRLSGE